MNAERLLNVAKALREAKVPERFNMNSYVHSCGTPSCALGNYACRTDLQSSFKLTQRGDDLCAPFWVFAHESERSFYGTAYYSPYVLEHFDISKRDAELLFGPIDRNPEDDTDERLAHVARTPIEAAEYIERFVAERPF